MEPQRKPQYQQKQNQTGNRTPNNNNGNNKKNNSQNKEENRSVAISKQMSYLLRHGAIKEGLKITNDGWVSMDDLLAFPKMKSKNITTQEVQDIVKSNDKQRFALKTDEKGNTWIRANQGHSLDSVEVEMTPIKSINQIATGIAVHGTYFDAWKIIKMDGLDKMKRNHIHFALGEPNSDQVISGMRSSAQVLIYLDIQKILNDNIPLFISENKVILSPGLNGKIEPKYFKQVKDKSGKILFTNS